METETVRTTGDRKVDDLRRRLKSAQAKVRRLTRELDAMRGTEQIVRPYRRLTDRYDDLMAGGL